MDNIKVLLKDPQRKLVVNPLSKVKVEIESDKKQPFTSI